LVYSVVRTDVNDYVNWQCELLEYTWKRAGQAGELVRLVACREDTPLPRHRYASVVRIEPEQDRCHGYKALESLFSLEHWLQREQPHGTVLVIDPDVVFRSAVGGEARPGAPRAQHWVDYRPVSSHTQAATWPMLIHTSDLRAILPRWIAFTSAIHAATGRWESDMHGLVSAAGCSGLKFSLEAIGAFVGWPDEMVGEAPIVHYCQDVVADDGRLLWSKRGYRPWGRVDGVEQARHSYCRDLLALVNEYAALRPGRESTT
jgi:hypothetical protein